MSFLDDIRKQPQHIREIMFGLCVVTTVSLVGMVWFNSFQKDMYALLNPEDVQQERFLAQENQRSLFGNLEKTFGDIGAIISGFWGSDGSNGGVKGGVDPVRGREGPQRASASNGVENNTPDRVYLLPLSETKR